MTADRVIKARRTSTCPMCRQLVTIGQQIGRTPTGWCHTQCIIEAAAILGIDPTAPKERTP
jgi:hypothetical protein